MLALILLVVALLLLGLGFAVHVLWILAVAALVVASLVWASDFLRSRP
jgi:hypothetical protein